jgi:hypothetical protein
MTAAYAEKVKLASTPGEPESGISLSAETRRRRVKKVKLALT